MKDDDVKIVKIKKLSRKEIWDTIDAVERQKKMDDYKEWRLTHRVFTIKCKFCGRSQRISVRI